MSQKPTVENPADVLLSSAQIAKRLQIDVQSVRKLARKGIIPHLVIGDRIMRFSWPEVRNALMLSTTDLRTTKGGARHAAR